MAASCASSGTMQEALQDAYLDSVAAQQARPCKPGDHVAQAADLGDGRHLRRHVHHMQPPRIPHTTRAISWAPCMHAWLVSALLDTLCTT